MLEGMQKSVCGKWLKMLDLLISAILQNKCFFLYKYTGEELKIEKRKIVLGLTGGLGTKANQCKIVLHKGFKIVALYDSIF